MHQRSEDHWQARPHRHPRASRPPQILESRTTLLHRLPDHLPHLLLRHQCPLLPSLHHRHQHQLPLLLHLQALRQAQQSQRPKIASDPSGQPTNQSNSPNQASSPRTASPSAAAPHKPTLHPRLHRAYRPLEARRANLRGVSVRRLRRRRGRGRRKRRRLRLGLVRMLLERLPVSVLGLGLQWALRLRLRLFLERLRHLLHRLSMSQKRMLPRRLHHLQ